MAVALESQSPRATETIGEVKILHLSDLHVCCGFGRSRWEDRWRDLLGNAKAIKPDIVILSGDLVNSPWRWALSRARRKVDDLRNESGCRRLLCIPGNHDTRLFGIVSPNWVYPLCAVVFICALVAWSLQLGIYE